MAAAPIFAATTPLPDSLLGNHYVNFPSAASFPSQNLLGPFPAGYGGAFQGDVYPSADSTTGVNNTPVLTTVWCVDYQLDVSAGSAYSANITQLSAIATPTDNTVRYGNSTTIWDNTVTGPGNLVNTAYYRYALAASLVSEYTDSANSLDPTNPVDSSRNQAIQTAIWDITYNSDYGATAWPPFDPTAYNVQQGSPATSQSNYLYWVNWAESNVGTVNLNDWAVISGPAPNGVLTSPNGVFQTFLVQLAPSTTFTGVAPEPTFYGLLALGLGVMLVAARYRKVRA